MELLKLKQSKDESLRDFLARFNAEAITVSTSQPDIVILALEHGLLPGPYRDHLIREQVSSLAEALRESDKYIRTEEFNKSLQPAPVEKKGQEPRKDRTRKDVVPTFDSYTPLTARIS